MEVRRADLADQPAVATVLDAAMLATDDLAGSIDAGDVLVAVEGGPILGAIVLEPPALAPSWSRARGTDAHVAAVAVRRRRRDQGIGTALVEAALDRGRVTAAFDADLREFYAGLGFALEAGDDGRLRGVADGRRVSGGP